MRPEERDGAYLWDMFQAAMEVEAVVQEHDLSAFLSNRVVVRATERMVEIIGEAAGRVSSSYRAAHPEVPWRESMARSTTNCSTRPRPKIFQN